MLLLKNIFWSRGRTEVAHLGLEDETWFDKYDCVLLVLCAETCCAMGDLGSARDYLTKAAKQAARFDGGTAAKSTDQNCLQKWEL